jgi:hypothetical protein
MDMVLQIASARNHFRNSLSVTVHPKAGYRPKESYQRKVLISYYFAPFSSFLLRFSLFFSAAFGFTRALSLFRGLIWSYGAQAKVEIEKCAQ